MMIPTRKTDTCRQIGAVSLPLTFHVQARSTHDVCAGCRPEGKLDTFEVEATARALHLGTQLTGEAASGAKLGPKEQATAESILAIPVAAQVPPSLGP